MVCQSSKAIDVLGRSTLMSTVNYGELKCTEIWSENIPDMFNLGLIWSLFGPNRTSLIPKINTNLLCVKGHSSTSVDNLCGGDAQSDNSADYLDQRIQRCQDVVFVIVWLTLQ